MVRLKIISTGFIFLVIQACSSVPMTSPQEQAVALQFQASHDKGVLYVYRVDQFQGGGVIYPIFVNGKIIGSMKSGTFLRTEVTPGQVQVISLTSTSQSVVPLSIQAGELKFISTAYHASAGTALLGIPGNISLNERDEANAKREIKGLRQTVSR